MSLKNEFNRIVKTRTIPGSKIGEVFLFDCLFDALLSCGAIGKRCHGKPGIVNFDIKVPISGATMSCNCEISDLFLIFYYGDHARYTFLQNKYSKSDNEHMIKNANCRQHYLLHELPYLKTTPKCLSVGNDILCNALLSGVGSYGDFFIDSKNLYDMRFFVGKALIPQSKYKSDSVFTNPGRTRYYICSVDDAHSLTCHHLTYQKIFSSNLDIFERAFCDSLIGTPLYFGENQGTEHLVKSAIKYVVDNNEESRLYQHYRTIIEELEIYGDRFSEYHISFEKMNIMIIDVRLFDFLKDE